jgi:hypothetical protein
VSRFHIDVTGGHFASDSDIRAAFEENASPDFRRAGFTLQSALMASSPVDTGTLRASWASGDPEWNGDEYALEVGTDVEYAEAADHTSRHPDYIEDAVNEAKPAIIEFLQHGIDAAAKGLWKNE